MSDYESRFKGLHLSVGDRSSRRGQITGRLVFGLLVLTLGALWTLDNLGFIDSDRIVRWWPALIVMLGLAKFAGLMGRRQIVAGSVFSIVGLVLLGNEFDMLHFRVWHLWPVLLIVMGSSLVMRSLRGPVAAPSDSDDRNAEVHTFAMMAGNHIKNESKDFRGGDLSAVMGGIELDLRGARTTSPQVVIDVFAWWGGIDLFVPRDWRVVSEITPIMAGVEDQSKPAEGEPTTTLILRGVAIMGGIEIKS